MYVCDRFGICVPCTILLYVLIKAMAVAENPKCFYSISFPISGRPVLKEWVNTEKKEGRIYMCARVNICT